MNVATSAYPKVVRNGKVAVLFSPGFGAGWYTWNDTHPELLFDPKVVEFVESDKRDEIHTYIEAKYGENIVYTGGARKLEIDWLPEGTAFRVGEYDGSESLDIYGRMDWIVA